MTTSIVTTQSAEGQDTVAGQLAADLHRLADLIAANPPIADIWGVGHAFSRVAVSFATKDEVAAVTRAAMRAGLTITKHQDDRWAGVDIRVGGRVSLHVFVERAEICERIVTGSHEVTEDVPDPDVLANVPIVTVTRTVEDVEWVCRPLLAEDES